MNLSEEISKVTETGVSTSSGITYPWIRPWDAEDIAKLYAEERAIAFAIYLAERYNTSAMWEEDIDHRVREIYEDFDKEVEVYI